ELLRDDRARAAAPARAGAPSLAQPADPGSGAATRRVRGGAGGSSAAARSVEVSARLIRAGERQLHSSAFWFRVFGVRLETRAGHRVRMIEREVRTAGLGGGEDCRSDPGRLG